MRPSPDLKNITMKTLIDLLQEIEASNLESTEFLHDGPTNPLVEEASMLASIELITSNGQPDRQKIAVLAKQGFRVTPGETDSFGWLTGIIYLKPGKLVFG